MDPLSYAASIVGGGVLLPALWVVIGRLRREERYWLPASVAGFGALLFMSMHLVSGVLGAIATLVGHDEASSGLSGSTILALAVTGTSLAMTAYAARLRKRNRAKAIAARQARARAHDAAAWAPDEAVYDEALQAFLAYDKDLELLLAHPMMRDYGDPMVRRIMETMATADGARTARDHAAYRTAAREFADAVRAAEETARRVRDSHFAPGEREKLRTAQQMLAHALDRSTDLGMRREIYTQITKLLDGVIVIDEEVTRRHTLALIDGTEPTRPLPQA